MAKIRILPKKSMDPKKVRNASEWVAEIAPVPSVPEKPIKSDNEAIEIDKWLKLVESYWHKERRRKA
jgi:hypothetical protein